MDNLNLFFKNTSIIFFDSKLFPIVNILVDDVSSETNNNLP